MRITDEVIVEAQEWVTSINKHFGIKREIVVRKGTDKRWKNRYAITTLSDDPDQHVIIELYPHVGKKDSDLFLIIYHEMIHILLWPLVEDNEIGGVLDKAEEKVVMALQSIMAKILAKVK
jgi:hypothetical protein